MITIILEQLKLKIRTVKQKISNKESYKIDELQEYIKEEYKKGYFRDMEKIQSWREEINDELIKRKT